MRIRRTTATAAVLAVALTGCMDEGPSIPPAGEQERPGIEPAEGEQHTPGTSGDEHGTPPTGDGGQESPDADEATE